MRKLPVFCLPRGMFDNRSRIAEEKRLPHLCRLVAFGKPTMHKSIDYMGSTSK